jgi:N-acetylmuramoyl-L-alanine amidase
MKRFKGIFRLWAGLVWGLAMAMTSVEGAGFSTVIIDPGHGGRDKGAYWGGVPESRLALKVALEVEKLLKKRGIKTVMTRRSDGFVSLGGRAAIANRHRSAVFVSIHFNASTNTSIKGAETFYWSSSGRRIAHQIQRRLAPRVQVRNRGIHRRGFTVLTQTRCPAVLVECGFISNSRERMRCSTQWYQETAARAIYDGLMAAR